MPDLWIVGSGTQSADVARKIGARYVHSHLHRAVPSLDAGDWPPEPEAVATFVICEESDATARDAEAECRMSEWQVIVSGSPKTCVDQICALAEQTRAAEVLLAFAGRRTRWPVAMRRISSELAARRSLAPPHSPDPDPTRSTYFKI